MIATPPPLKWLLPAVAILVLTTGPVAAQNYPWCANFADGAGTNCGFVTEQQCMTTIAGSGGYCSSNNLYQASAAPARRPATKRHSASGAVKN